MNKNIKLGLMAAAIFGMTAPAALAADDDPDYLRSSLYTILVSSKKQNDRIDKENNEAAGNEYLEMIKGFNNTDAKKAANETSNKPLSELPMEAFLKIAIPNQFNDHNLGIRVLDYDALREGISKEDADAANAEVGKKKKGGGFGKMLAGAALSAVAGQEVNLINQDDTQDYMVAVLKKFMKADNTAAKMVGRWFDYNKDNENHWDLELKTLNDRALQSLNIADQSASGEAKMMAAGAKGLNLIPNTFLMTVNLSFRSNKAILAESQKLAGGLLGKDNAALLGAAAGAIAGDGYSVTAQTNLYQLVWDEEVSAKVQDKIMANATLEDLVSEGLCTLKYIGTEKSKARVRQSINSSKPMSDLVQVATTRAIDAAIANLQNKNEVFRTVFPISSCDADGSIKVKIGAREGVSKGDTYAILEKQEDANGKISYKEVATVKPNEKMIWNNIAGAEEQAAEGKDDDKEFDNSSVNLGATTFVGKKGKDFSGYYIQLKKKK